MEVPGEPIHYALGRMQQPTAILDRLLHHSRILNIKGRSYRLRDLEDATEACS